MHVRCACTSSLHFSSTSDPSNLRKQSSRADLVWGQAQQLQSRRTSRFRQMMWRFREIAGSEGNIRLQALGIKRVLLGVSRVIRRLCWRRRCWGWGPKGGDLWTFLVSVNRKTRLVIRSLFQAFPRTLAAKLTQTVRDVRRTDEVETYWVKRLTTTC